ncbi:hypothetical protein [Enterococcus gallinarum]|uniref:hypothetical protein n=1 Tax=Enterococcus gallinarum TaxID=1353 RepID=UPI0029558262|nr:hypothetical protein [Enterococcus gallinarum]MDV7740867.1 hypothetical protein [Enterococcus gallinarum]
MSEVEKTLTDAYYWLSMYKSGAITEGVAMEKVKKAIFAQPQLNENQEIVLWWLKEEQTKNPELSIFGTLSVLFDESENRFMNLDVIDALNDLSNSQQAGVFQAFSKWSLEQEEE